MALPCCRELTVPTMASWSEASGNPRWDYCFALPALSRCQERHCWSKPNNCWRSRLLGAEVLGLDYHSCDTSRGRLLVLRFVRMVLTFRCWCNSWAKLTMSVSSAFSHTNNSTTSMRRAPDSTRLTIA